MASNPPKPRGSAQLLDPHNIRTSPYYYHIASSTGSTNTINFAGQIGVRADNTIPSDPVEQMHEAFTNLGKCLSAAGAQVEDIQKLTYFIVDYDHTRPLHREPVRRFMGDYHPPTTLVPVPKLALPGVIFEVEAVAAIPFAPTAERVDVVVVGAGLSGLQAAVDLHKAGLRVKVLEARDRVGGKTCSVPVRGGTCDVGAAWINDSNQARMITLAKRFGLSLVEQNTKGRIVMDDGIGKLKTHPYGGDLVKEEEDWEDLDDVVRVRNIFEETCQKIDTSNPVVSGRKIREDLDQISFEEWIRSLGCREAALNALKVGTRALLGIEPSEVSALYILDYCKCSGGYLQMRSDGKHGGQYLRLAKGTQSFSYGLAAELPSDTISLLSPVRRIEQDGCLVRVFSARGIYEASRVIVSVPTPLYKEIEFHPALPEEKIRLSQSTKLGDYCKSIFFYEKPWWREANLCGLAQSSNGPFAVTRDSSVDADGQFSLTCFITGQPARDWMVLSREDRDRAVLNKIQKLYGPFATVPQPVEIVEKIWANEQWSQGCPCPVMPPGALTEFEHILRTACERIHFVGTEMAYEWKGYMEGAVSSGERGAQEVLLAMNRAKI